ncbi:MAG: hypothetical protein KDK99_05145 [Verrucomicrobiales bacterium]|nr:hypothetical protein [Verrucomicrobiales bacterium]
MPRTLVIPATVCLMLTSAAQAVDFKKDIRPILKEHCYECHSEETGKKKAGYVFDDLEVFKLDISPKGIVVAGEPGESYFLEVMTMPTSEKAHMPPKDQLKDSDIAKVREWISAGALLDAAPPPSALPARAAAPAMQAWTNAEGTTIQAALLRVEGENVIFKLQDGRELPYPITKLSAESQTKARETAGQ